MPERFDEVLPYGRQSIGEDDVRAVKDALTRDFLTQGPTINAFEKALCDTVNAIYVRTASSATTALHLVYSALDLKDGDYLWTSPITFVSTANAARFCGAKVDFVDVDPMTGNMSDQKLAEKLDHASKCGRLPKIVVPVQMAGASCQMNSIKALCDNYDVLVVEDASHALGASYRDSRVGDCKYSDATVFSFHPVKMITTGEGGCVTTNDCNLATKIESLRSHGITKNPQEFIKMSDGGWYYEQHSLGFNYRMTDIQAALGMTQLTKLAAFVEARNEIAGWYTEYLPAQARPILPIPETRSSYHLFMVQLPNSETRRRLYDYLHANKVLAQVHYIPVHYQPYYRDLGFKVGDFPNAELFYSRVISLPIFPGLTREHVKRVCSLVNECVTSCK